MTLFRKLSFKKYFGIHTLFETCFKMEFKYHFARVVLQTLTLTMVYIAFHPVSFLIRWILPKIAAFCGKKDYKKLVERSNVPLASLAYVEANSSILVTATVKGPLPLERLKFAFAETVKRPEYEKMTQIPSPFLGKKHYPIFLEGCFFAFYFLAAVKPVL